MPNNYNKNIKAARNDWSFFMVNLWNERWTYLASSICPLYPHGESASVWNSFGWIPLQEFIKVRALEFIHSDCSKPDLQLNTEHDLDAFETCSWIRLWSTCPPNSCISWNHWNGCRFIFFPHILGGVQTFIYIFTTIHMIEQLVSLGAG